LPNRWILGAVVGVDVDARDHVWIVHRPSTLPAKRDAVDLAGGAACSIHARG
jgi:hypothetical protein